MSKGYKPSYTHGGYKAICDSCGFLRKNFEMRMRWDGLFVCSDTCWEPRQPQDFVRTVPGEGRPVPIPRPDSTPAFQSLPSDFDSYLPPTEG